MQQLAACCLTVNFTRAAVARTELLPAVYAAAFQYWCFIFVHLIWHDCLLKVAKKNFWCKLHWGDTMRHIGTCNEIFDIPRFNFHGHFVHKLLKLIWRQHILCFYVNAVAFMCSSVSGFDFWSLCCAFSAFCRVKAEKKKFPQCAFQRPVLWKLHSLFTVLLLTDMSVSASTWISCCWHGLGSESVSVYEKAHVRWRKLFSLPALKQAIISTFIFLVLHWHKELSWVELLILYFAKDVDCTRNKKGIHPVLPLFVVRTLVPSYHLPNKHTNFNGSFVRRHTFQVISVHVC